MQTLALCMHGYFRRGSSSRFNSALTKVVASCGTRMCSTCNRTTTPAIHAYPSRSAQNLASFPSSAAVSRPSTRALEPCQIRCRNYSKHNTRLESINIVTRYILSPQTQYRAYYENTQPLLRRQPPRHWGETLCSVNWVATLIVWCIFAATPLHVHQDRVLRCFCAMACFRLKEVDRAIVDRIARSTIEERAATIG